MRTNRRKVLVGAGAAVFGAAGIGAGQSVLADGHTIPVKIAEANPTEETIILENTGSEAVDLGGYQLDWQRSAGLEGEYEYEIEYNHTETFEDGLTIKPSEQLSVKSGFDDSESDYQNWALAEDVISLLSPKGETVATETVEYGLSRRDSSDDDSGSDSDSDMDSDNAGDESPTSTDEESGDSDEDTSDDTDAESDSDSNTDDKENTEC